MDKDIITENAQIQKYNVQILIFLVPNMEQTVILDMKHKHILKNVQYTKPVKKSKIIN